ncbi:hypothetical protein [Acidisphaera sp. S103]|uniref:hypothetical protein n=1 Tax=Acidisphaera sp. S103 TaxID=1747223 RepID=UPI00131D1D3D|nr:hypothetical protein [Acidisphaera sp. S103]
MNGEYTLIRLCLLAVLALLPCSARAQCTNPAETCKPHIPQPDVSRPYSLTEAGAKCDGKTDDTAAIDAWWFHLMRHGGKGALPVGTCVARSPIVWDMTKRRNGIRIAGAGQGQSVLDLRAIESGTPLLITAAKAMFYGHFSDFTVLTDTKGPGVQLGRPDLTDALNGFTFTQMEFKNAANDEAAVALQVNGCVNCDFETITTNTGGGSITGTGKGVSLQLRYAAFSRFMGSFSDAGTGVQLTRGYVFGNVFEALDIEVVNTAILVDSPHAARNTFIGGQFAAMTGLNFTAGNANIVTNPNIALYRGGVAVAGTQGLWLQQAEANVITPAVPPSGTAVTNTTGHLVLVAVYGGAVTRVGVGGSIHALRQGTMIVRPGETVTLVYTSAPAWEWRPVL